MNKFNGSGQMHDTHGTDETDSTGDYRDDVELAGMAVGDTCVDATGTSRIVHGTHDIQLDKETLTTHALVNVRETDHVVDTVADRVEVM